MSRSSLTMNQLLQKASQEKENTESRRKLLIEFHRRLVLPFGCLMISLMGLPLGLQARPGKKAIGIQAGLAIFILYYILFTVSKTFAEEDVLPIAFAMWAPNCLFLLMTVFWIFRVANEKPLFPEVITLFFKEKLGIISLGLSKLYNNAIYKLKGIEQVAKQSDDSLHSPAAETAIRGNVISRVFHLPECDFYDCKNCTIEFKNVKIAMDVGFEPCRFCKKLMDE